MRCRFELPCFLCLNIALIYWLAKLVTNSTEMAVIAALLGAYHNRLIDIYIFGGMIYDVLCFTFYVSALCVYIRARSGGAALRWRAFVAFIALNILALNSKEMAATLPVVLLAYELLYQRTYLLRKPGAIQKLAPALVSLTMTIGATVIRTGAGTVFSGNAAYAIHPSVRQFFLTTRQMLDDLFLLHAGTISTTKAVLIFVAIWGIATCVRSRPLMFAAFFITVAPLPVNFIEPRGFFPMYLTLAGWAMYFAILMVASRNWLLEKVWRRPMLPAGWQPERVALFVCVLWALFDIHARDQARSFVDADRLTAPIRSLAGSLTRIHAPMPKGGSVLFLSYAIEDRWQPVFIVRLFYRDPTIRVDRAWQDSLTGRYDLILALCDQGYCDARR